MRDAELYQAILGLSELWSRLCNLSSVNSYLVKRSPCPPM